MSHDVMEQIIAGHAVGSSDAAAEREILEHIAACDSCRGFYLEMREVSGDLALAAPAMAVPAGLEERILAGVRGQKAMPVARPQRSISLRIASVAAAVMLVTVGGLATFAASISSRVGREERQTQATTRALSIVSRSDARRTTLTGDAGSMLLAYTPQGDAVLLGSGIAEPADGLVMELWLIRDGVPLPVDVFRPDNGVVVVPLTVSPQFDDVMAITFERGKVQRPTRTPVYSAKIT